MDDQYSPFSTSFYYLDEVNHAAALSLNGIEEYLKQSLFYNSVDLENTIFSAREELARKDEELMHLKILLTNTAKERDEAIAKYDELMLENMLLQQPKLQNESALSNGSFSIEEDQETPLSATGLCSSDSDENVVSLTPLTQTIDDMMEKIEPRKPLPEKGKFLKAVMESGPLLQTLLVAGPLPQWQHPPPHLSSIDIPPVTLSSPVSALPSKAVALSRRGLIF